MSNYMNKVKTAFLRGLESIGRGAANMADNAHDRLNEMNLETRRREILSEFPIRALELYQKGTELPQPLNEMLAELTTLDSQLALIHAQRYAKVENETASASEESAVETAEEPAAESILESAPEQGESEDGENAETGEEEFVEEETTEPAEPAEPSETEAEPESRAAVEWNAEEETTVENAEGEVSEADTEADPQE